MIYTINNCIRAFGYTNFDRLIEDMGSVDNLKAYVIANGYADIAVAEDTELLLVDVNGKTWHTGCYGAVIEPPKPYLCFTSTGDSTVAMTQNGTPNTSAGKVIQYKLNNGRWQTWDLSAVSLADGDKMYLKSDDEIPISEAQATYKMFVMSGSIAVTGNIMSLVNFSDTLTDYAFYRMFRECTSLTQAPELPATTLSRRCYNEMFNRCTSLVQAPELPSTTLSSECYMFMFSGCTSLTQAPALPANRLTYMCYYNMFKGCTSLTQAPALPATTLAEQCYSEMFRECTSLAQAPVLPATSLSAYCYSSMFFGCTSLTQAPVLPAKSLYNADNCYENMFFNCTSLTTAPALPATTLGTKCYMSMFHGCSALTQAPALPAITLKKECYYGMFYGCALTTAPALPATTLAMGCYHNMFYECILLTQAPELHATTLEAECYESMFHGCSALTQAPALPATTLQRACYLSMFENCVSLTTAPELPATKIDGVSYANMFKNCQKLNYVKAMFTYIQYFDSNASDWLYGVSPTGTFIKSKDATWTNEQAGIPTGWTVQVEGGVTPEPELDYLCFTSTGDSTVAMTQNGTPNRSAGKVIQYKLNNGQWQTWDMSAVTLHDADKMYLKSDDEIPMSESYEIYKQFTITGSIAASGNVMSLLNFSNTLEDYVFFKLFNNCTALTTAPKLQATTLKDSCCASMFNGCTSLTAAPELHATTLGTYCYNNIFSGCTSLTQAPELPHTTLETGCYSFMFNNCTSLVNAPALPSTTLKGSCYDGMFNGCTSLTTAPELPATTLAYGCYFRMFDGCTNLNYVKAMFTTIPNGTLNPWLTNVSPTGTFVKNSAATWTNEDAKIPSGWTVQTASPDK